MHPFAVWAPRAKTCSVKVNQARHRMAPKEHGWWTVELANAGHGTDYSYILDGDPQPLPDPRSAWQPYGVHGESRVLDHLQYCWNDQGWSPVPLSHAVIYELHIGTFTPEGTFTAAISKLSYLCRLGVTHVELMPVNSFPGRWGWGYDGVALFAPQEQYGGPEALKQFVDACHVIGMAVLLDVVYNHFGPDGNYTGRFGNYITENHETPWGGAINLDGTGSDEVRRFLCDNALMWLRDYHFDGLRLDAIHAFVDRSVKHLLEQLSEEVEVLSCQVNRDLVLIAESDLNDPRVVTPRGRFGGDYRSEAGHYGRGGLGIDAQWSDDFHHSVFALLTGERYGYYKDFGTLAQVAKALKSVYVYDGQYSKYRRCVHGRPVHGLSAHRFLGYIQNHDQIGNRAFGDRLHQVAGIAKARLAAALVLTAPFVPMIFQGEEFAASSPFLYFADHDDPELARAVSLGRLREHGHVALKESIPDPESQSSFDRSKLHWKEVEESMHSKILEWYRRLIQLRKSHPSLLDGNLDKIDVQFDEAGLWLIVKRGSVQLFYNFGQGSVSLSASANSHLLLASDYVQLEGNQVILPGFGFVALAC